MRITGFMKIPFYLSTTSLCGGGLGFQGKLHLGAFHWYIDVCDL
jgi:hypothetical protein